MFFRQYPKNTHKIVYFFSKLVNTFVLILNSLWRSYDFILRFWIKSDILKLLRCRGQKILEDVSPIVEKIIQFEKDHNMTDSDLAFASHISVEHIHAIKAGIGHIEPEILNDLQNFFAAN